MTDISLLSRVRNHLLRMEQEVEDAGDTVLAFRLGLLADELHEEIKEALDDGSFK